MANPEHLQILKQGVEVWNAWRVKDDKAIPDFSGANLSGRSLINVDLSRANLVSANLAEVNLSDASLDGAQLAGATLLNANLKHAKLNRASLLGAYIVGANLLNAKMSRASLASANLTGATLTGTELNEANLINTNLTNTILDRCNATGAIFLRSILKGAVLKDAILSSADLRDADLQGVDLTNADLDRTDLDRAILQDAKLNQAQLSYVTLRAANLSGATLDGARIVGAELNKTDLAGATIDHGTISGAIFIDVDFREVKGLESVHHFGPSILSASTLAISQGQLPESFLQGCGLKDWEIEVVKLYRADLTPSQFTDITYKIYDLRSNPLIQFYSCFISYSGSDEKFAARLFMDLQSHGVRCWFAPEHMKIGDRIRNRIDDSIRLHDKLLLVLSESSIKSQWVEQEVETALEKERERGESVLFPVRLDETVMNIGNGWPKLIKNTRHIGNFSSWENPSDYERAFSQLLNDLRANL